MTTTNADERPMSNIVSTDPPPPADVDIITRAERTILALDFETATPDQVSMAIQIIDAMKVRSKALADQFEGALLAWLQFHGDLTIGDTRYYVGSTKVIKCNNPAATVEALLVAADGALDGIEQCLVSQPFKTGATRTILGDEKFTEQFSTMTIADIKTGKPLRKVQKASLTYTKGKTNEEA